MQRTVTFLLLGLITSLACLSKPALALEQVTLQLKWSHAFQFAGYYAAKELGFYESAGLDVEIKALQPGQNVVQEVISGRANYGTASSGLLLARQAGAPVVVLATIFQHSPYVLIARKFKENQSVKDLDGKPMELRPLSDELLVYLNRENVNLKNVTTSSSSMNTVANLLNNKVAAISGYVGNEPYRLAEAKMPMIVYSPRSIGIDIYGDNLFTSAREISKQGRRTERFRVASLQGWEYILSHPDEAVALVQKYAPDMSAEQIAFERAKLEPLIRADLVPVGYMNESRWQHTVDVFKESGGLKEKFSLEGFVYDPSPKKDLTWLYGSLVVTIAVLMCVCAVVYYIWRLNQRLNISLSQVQHMAHHDSLTGLPNRDLFIDRLQRAILKARREKSLLALLFIDVDHFKGINDQFGHSAGDEVLKACCNRMMACIRDSDSLGRMGGDEFVVLLEDLQDPRAAMEVAKKFQAAVSFGVSVNGEFIPTTLSIGIAIYPSDADMEEGLFKRADSAMYKAKQAGRNTIRFYAEPAAPAAASTA